MKPCPEQLSRLSALVDGALSAEEQDRVHAHLVHCPGCRAEISELRSLRGLLSGTAPQDSVGARSSQPSGDLSARLVGIAGANASDPLWTRTFHRSGAGDRPRLPHSQRRQNRRRTARVSASLAGVAVVAVAAGWSAAPPTRTPTIDPAASARSEFAGALNEMPLGNQAAAAAAMADLPSRQSGHVDTPLVTGADSLPATEARELLSAAAAANHQVSLNGTQDVQVRHRAGYWVTEVGVRSQAGQGFELQVNPEQGSPSRFVGIDEPAPVDLATDYELTGGQVSTVAGREATVLTARQGGHAAARWWIDKDQGFLLWQETYGSTGEVTQSSGFTAVEVMAAQPSSFNHLAPRLGMGQNAASMSLSQSPRLNSGGWTCAQTLAEMSLVQLQADRADAPGQVNTVYSDGVHTLSVVQHRGALTGPPTGFVWDPELNAYRNVGMTTMLAWQSSDTVFTIATDGGPDLARTAMEQLPRQEPVLRTRADRVVDGWRHIAHAVLGR